jgi:DedD protein
MRFEIGPGGGFVILVGLLGLSAAVFFLGMISGREMAQSEQNQSQLASVYPMPAGAPAASPPHVAEPAAPPSVAPVAAATPKAPPRVAIASRTMPPPAASPKPPLVHKAPPRPTLASVPPPHPSAPAAEESDTGSSASSGSASSDEADTGTDEETAGAPPPSTGRHHGYNIVIDAAMDRGAANRMSSRLLGLGYSSHIVPRQINGQTWYRVQVGPYPTADDARAAQAQLRAAYTARYVNRARRTATGAAAATGGAGAGNAGSRNTGTGDSGATDSGLDDSGGGGDSAPTD